MSEAPIDQHQYQGRHQSYSPRPQSSTSTGHLSTAAGSPRRISSQTPTRSASASSKRRPSAKPTTYGNTGVFSHDLSSSSAAGIMDPAAEITYTPTTGRISKAKKGKKVHVCEYPGCGKVFSRAEHRKRHEANHNPEPLFTCDIGDCRRPFQRQDLLTRHLERQHNISAPSSAGSKDRRRRTSSLASSATPSQANSPGTVPSTTNGKQSVATNLTEVTSTSGTLPYAPTISLAPVMDPEPLPWSSPMACGNLPIGLIRDFYGSDESNYSPPTSCYSPVSNESEQVYTTQPYPSYNPVPSRSLSYSTDYQPPTYVPQTLNGSFGWTSQFDQLPQALNGQGITFEGQFPTPVDSSKSANSFVARSNRQPNLWGESAHAAGMATSQHGLVKPDIEALQDYHFCYWKYFHRILPIVHHATYSASSLPQLSTIMLAIGAQFSRLPLAKSHSQQMFELASKLASLMDEVTSRSSVSDLQSLILREAFSLYRSRAAGVQQSPQFIKLYSSLLNSRKLLDMDLIPNNRLGEISSYDDLRIARQEWADLEARRRVLLAAFVLDTQRSIYFPQQAQPTFSAVNGAKLPSPCPQEMWDCNNLAEWRDHFSRHRTHALGNGSPSFSRFHTNILQCINIHCNSPSFAALATVQTSCPSHHSLLAATNTPIPSLLIVAAESWLYARKIEDPARCASAKIELRNWVNTDVASRAVWRAGYVLRSGFRGVEEKHGGPGLQGEWILYLAALVCWAYGFSRDARDQDINSGNFATLSQQEREARLLKYLEALDVENWRDVEWARGRGGTKPVLEWVRGKMALAGGRLISEGQSVLEKLIKGKARGCEF